MNKKKKTLIGVSLSFGIISMIGYSVLSIINDRQADIISYPKGTLTESLFESQNNEYIPDERLAKTYAFSTAPYLIDVYDKPEAKVGNGSIIQMEDDTYSYITEYESGKTPKDVLLSEFPPALLINFDPSHTVYETLESQAGYINGFMASYFFNTFSISNGDSVVTAYSVGYELIQTQNPQAPHFIVAVATTRASTSHFANCKAAVDIMVNTLRYDEKLEKDQQKETEKIEKEKELEEKKAETIADTPQTGGYFDPLELILPEDVDAKLYPVTTQKQDVPTECFISVTVERIIPDAEIRLFEGEKGKEILLSTRTDNRYLFQVMAEEAKPYYVKTTHNEELGKIEISVNMQQEESEETNETESEE